MAAVVALSIGLGPAAASAAPKTSNAPTGVQIVGTGLSEKIAVQKADQPNLFTTLLDEVNWLSSAKPQISAPAAGKLGAAKYTVTVLVGAKPSQTYDLYPLATGGPRAHRPAKQPSGKTVADGWFYGRLTMPESLRVSGAPLQAKPDVVTAGIGGGVGQDITSGAPTDPATGLNNFLSNVRRLLLLNGAVLIVILFGLAGIAFVIRRRV
jgi:hypothetical protein